MEQVIMVTGNLDKFTSACERLKPFNIPLIQKKLDIIEPQEENIQKVAEFKAFQAYDLVKSPVIISDTGWSISGLKGFPGPFMHYISEWFNGEDLARLLSGISDRTVIIENVAVFKNGIETKVFSSVRKGYLVDQPRGEGVAIDQLASFRSDRKTIAECKEQNLVWFDTEITDSIWSQFGKWYSEKTNG